MHKLGKSVVVAAVYIVTCSCSDNMSCYIMSCIWEQDNKGFCPGTDIVRVQGMSYAVGVHVPSLIPFVIIHMNYFEMMLPFSIYLMVKPFLF
jgi:hypothetical protein